MSRSKSLDAWHRKAGVLLDDALEMLCDQNTSPSSDGALGEWIRQLARFQFEERHAAPIARLIRKDDVFLAEAGVNLAIPLIARHPETSSEIVPAVEALLQRKRVDDWVLFAVAHLMGCSLATRDPEWIGVYRELARILSEPQDQRTPHAFHENRIMRNMAIHPHRDLLTFFEHGFLDTRVATAVDVIVLPLLEKTHGTKGFEATQRKIFEALGLDADVYLARIAEP